MSCITGSDDIMDLAEESSQSEKTYQVPSVDMPDTKPIQLNVWDQFCNNCCHIDFFANCMSYIATLPENLETHVDREFMSDGKPPSTKRRRVSPGFQQTMITKWSEKVRLRKFMTPGDRNNSIYFTQ